jgi:pyruvate ferredoxin oxidoreductase beta subunit
MPRLKHMALREHGTPPLHGGHALCQGCGIPIVVRTVLDSIDTPVVVVNATGCLEVATTRYPTTAWNVASGVESAFRALQRRGRLPQDEKITFVCFAGDGGTYDIGLQALSGMLERGHKVLFVCYDNEAYMNTGIQRSGATPFGADTTTSPAGTVSLGKAQQRKDITGIAVAHGIPYAAQAAASQWHDLSQKAEKAANAEHAAFLNILSDCPLGWGHEARDGIHILDLAVESRFWPLYEVVEGRYALSYVPRQPIPVEEFLRSQKRFAHLFKDGNGEVLEEIQRRVDREWDVLVERCGDRVAA